MAKKNSIKKQPDPSDIEMEMEFDEPDTDPMEIMQCPKCGTTLFVLDAVNRGGNFYCQKCAEQIPMSEIQKYIFSFNDRNVTLLYDGFMEHFDQIIGSVRSHYDKDVNIKVKFEPKLEDLVSRIKGLVDVIADLCGVLKK